MANFSKELPEWIETGVEPPHNKRAEGWKPDERPPAEYMNWLFNKNYEAFKELQENALHKEGTEITSINQRVTDLELDTPIIQQDTEPTEAEEGELWLDTSDDAFQGTVFQELNNKVDSQAAQLAETMTQLDDAGAKIDKTILQEASRANGLSKQNGFHFPTFTKSASNPLITREMLPASPVVGLAYVLQFAAILPAYKYLTNPVDNYYLYASSHDGEGCWLYTAPTPEGNWTLYSETPVVNVGTFSWATGHISSPEVFFDEITKKVMLYVHSPQPDTIRQFTQLATSNDGISFTPYGTAPVLASNGHLDRWNGKSVSYMRAIKVGDAYYGVYQANGNFTNEQVGTTTASIGICYSKDGYNWELSDRPLFANGHLSRGAFSPEIFHWNDFFVILYRDDNNELKGLITKDFTQGSFETIGIVLKKGTTGAYDDSLLLSPKLFFDNGSLYLYYGFNGQAKGISVAKAEVNL